jgi:hypothetical protein
MGPLPAAVANAIYNATGVRDYPITLDKVIDRVPSVAEIRASHATTRVPLAALALGRRRASSPTIP